jgi:hypothetical protein
VTYLERARKIAYLILYMKDELKSLKHQLGGSRGNLSDQALAQLLNTAQAHRPGALSFDAKRINDIWNGKALNASSEEQAAILQALRILMRRQKLDLALLDEFPIWMEEKYASELPEIFRSADVRSPEGEHLGSHATSLPGAWLLFYVRPLNDAGKPEPVIRCQLALFGRARPESTSTKFMLLSKGHRWAGHAVLHESYLYITCTEQRGRDSAFIIINAPRRSDDYLFAGLALTVIQPPRRHAPLAAVPCFGQPVNADNLDDAQHEAIHQATESGRVSSEIESALRSILKPTTYKADGDKQFRADYPALATYLDSVEINGRLKDLAQSLRISWP